MVGMTVPSGVSAATTQQLLNQALKNQSASQRPMVMDGRFDVTGKSVLFKGNVEQGKGMASMRMMSRSLAPKVGQKMVDSEGQIILEKAEISDKKTGEEISITKPVGFEWKTIDSALYFRAKDVPMEWVNELPEEARQYVNQWLKLAVPKELLANTQNDGLIAPALQPQDVLKASLGKTLSDTDLLKQKLQNMSVFLVTRTEKKMVVDGKTILRLRVVLNPALITLLQNEEYKALRGYSASYRREELARINKKYTEIRTALRKFSFVMELNTTDTVVRRMEVGASFTEPVQDCTWNVRLNKSVCKTTGRSTFTLAGGFNFNVKETGAIEAPAASVDLMQLFNDYMKNSLGASTEASTTDETAVDATTTVTQ